MGAIVDTLYADAEQIALLKERYPACYLSKQGDTELEIQKYRVVIPDELEEDYYNFLVDNSIAMSSVNFLNRVESDDRFVRKLKARIAERLAATKR